jgi:hypothetical protein
MQLPIAFPSQEEVIREEVARFRALTPDDRVHAFDEMFRLYHFLRETSGRQERIDRIADREEDEARRSILAFASRHV